MTAPRFFHFTVSVFAASALLAGCGGSANVAPSSAIEDASARRAWQVGARHCGDRIAMPRGRCINSFGDTLVDGAQRGAAATALRIRPRHQRWSTSSRIRRDTLRSGHCPDFSFLKACAPMRGRQRLRRRPTATQRMREYAHGSITPKATLPRSRVIRTDQLRDRSDDRKPRASATPPEADGAQQQGNVALYKGAIGSPIAYFSAPSLHRVFFLRRTTASGNLWVDGQSSAADVRSRRIEKGRKEVHAYFRESNVPLRPGDVLWVGKYLAIGDLTTSAIYRFLVTGDKATTVGPVPLTGRD